MKCPFSNDSYCSESRKKMCLYVKDQRIETVCKCEEQSNVG